MNWEKLLSDRRLLKETPRSLSGGGRSEFQRDFDRIVFSPAFRRLQNKTQVFPLPEDDFIHTRLTHSLEVSCVGRSLGNLAGKHIINKNASLKTKFSQYHFGEITAAACLAHDIGNPPFGHSGEDAISEFFSNGEGARLIEEIGDDKKKSDLKNFEGNAQGFRLISKTQNPNLPGGLQLTYATLGAFIKYPRESKIKPASGNSHVLTSKTHKKYGFFQSEKEIFKNIASELELSKINCADDSICFARHPLAFLVEAADDICYQIMDIEDGFKLGLFSFGEIEELLCNIIEKDKLKGYNKLEHGDKIAYLRAKTIDELAKQISSAFIEAEPQIIEGNFFGDLISLIPSLNGVKIIKEASKSRMYMHKSVVERELAGYEVIGGLLKIIANAIKKDIIITRKAKSAFKILPPQFHKESFNSLELYEKLLLAVDYISGMTDSYAISFYRKLMGISLPGK